MHTHTHIYIYTHYFSIQYTHAYSQREFIPIMILFIENLISKSITGRMTCARPTSSSASSTPAVAMMCRRLAMKTFITVHQKCETEWHITYIHACTHTRTDAYVVYNYTYNYSYLCIYIYTYYIIYSILYILYPILYIYVGVTGVGHHLCIFLRSKFNDARIRAPGPAAHRPSSWSLAAAGTRGDGHGSWPSRDG